MHWSVHLSRQTVGGGVSNQEPLAPLVTLTRAPEAGLAAGQHGTWTTCLWILSKKDRRHSHPGVIPGPPCSP